MVGNTTDEGLIAYLVLTSVVVLLYIDHAVHAFRLWRQERRLRSLRNFFIAVMLLVGMAVLLLGATARMVPLLGEWAVFLGSVLRGMLLVGGLAIFYSWRKDR